MTRRRTDASSREAPREAKIATPRAQVAAAAPEANDTGPAPQVDIAGAGEPARIAAAETCGSPAACGGAGGSDTPGDATRASEPARRVRPEAEQTFSIGDLADEFDITTRTIRFYESRHLIAPNRRGTQRFYTRRDRARLSIILRAKNLGFSLEDVAAYLDLYDADPGQLTQTRMLLEKVEATIADLQKKRADLDRTLRDLKDIKSRCAEHLARAEPAGGAKRDRTDPADGD